MARNHPDPPQGQGCIRRDTGESAVLGVISIQICREIRNLEMCRCKLTYAVVQMLFLKLETSLT